MKLPGVHVGFQALRMTVVARDATIAKLNDLVTRAMASAQPTDTEEQSGDTDRATTAQLVTDLRRRLASEIAGRKKLERRLASLATERDDTRRQHRLLEETERDLRQELEAAELSMAAQLPEPGRESEPPVSMSGTTVLYVGGRAHQVVQLRILAERSGAVFLHHDGGIENRSALLEAQVARSDVVFFPVDCVSHNAVATVKRISRYVGKRYIALRSSGLTSFAAALRSIAAAQRPAGDVCTGAQPQPM